jgi:uncharacterized membrane protein
MLPLAAQAFLDQGGLQVIHMLCGMGIIFAVFGAVFSHFFKT